MMKTQLTYFFKDIFTKSTIQNTKQKYPIKLNNLKYKNLIGNKHNNKLLYNFRFLFASSLLTLSLNVSSSDTQAFNKDAYLDLSKPYTYNWNNTQSYTKKDNQANKLLKQVGTTIGSTVHSAIGSTNSDNANQFGNKITTGIKGQLKNQAISNVESRINQKANEYANSFGKGKTEISIRKITSKNPDYSLRTIQPLTPLNDDSTELTFVQAQLNSGENFGERKSTLNLGVGYRQLLEQGQSIAGINLFTDYESKSKHKRGSVGLEYQRANFNLNVNKYFPLSDKKMIGDDTEDPLAGYDVKFSGQVPYLPWAKVKATRYIWDGVAQPNVKGTIFGIEVQLSDSVRMEFGSEDNNTVERKTYARFTTALPLSDHESMTSFSISKKAFQNSDIVNLGDLEFVERSNKIRVEKLLNGVTVVLGEYNAPTKGASCTLYNSAGVALGTSLTGDNGQVDLKGIALIPRGLVSVACKGGTYTDEATGKLIDLGQMVIRAATIYSGTGPLMMLSSPLSEVAYQLADTNSGDRTVIAKAIMRQNIAVAAAFGVTGIDITTTTPTDINTNKATNDDAGKFGMALAAVSQMGENSADSSPAETITALVADMADGNIDGRVVGKQTVDMTTAMNNFSNGEGANNITDGKGAGNVIGVTNSVAFITLGEATTNTYTVVLNTQPTGNVTITPNSNDTGAATVSAAMTFTSANWSTPQTVTVTGVNDADATDETVTISHTITGAGYAGVTSANVIASVTDDEIFFNNLVYSTVTSPDTGKVWLDRNLGATQVATSKTDSAAYGHYYQWGRNDDGHESSSSAAVATIASSITNAGNLFITSDIDWTNADTSGALRTVAWADGGANDICPAGFSVPTEAELTADTIGATTTNITNIDTVFSSFLKIPTAGYRNRANNGSFHSAGSLVLLWSRGTNGVKAHNLNISSGTATSSYIDHAYGFSVRCIKN
ncbi:hypothetical protein BSPWISOX_1910 [uncultured Gammaproteobacteria bacterium]|nr:hypothetical protein BSPWISOX_1910 [uncultured Gammaproteobacteria bacterium]